MGTVLDFGMFRRMAYVVQGLMGRRNLYNVFNYSISPTYDQKFFKYLRQDVAARIVDAPADALWTSPPLVTSTSPEWNTLWDDLISRFSLFNNIARVDKLAGIGRYSLLLIGYNDGGKLNTPVNTRAITQKADKILYLQPYGEGTVTVVAYNMDETSEDFQKPLMYRVTPMQQWVIGFEGRMSSRDNILTSFEVHASRVIHVAENILENGIYGSPRMERVYNILDDILKVTGGSAETFWLTANRGLHIDVDKEMEMDPQDAKDLSDEVDEYSNELRRVIRTRGTKITSLGSDNPDPTGVFKMLISVLSGATGIPQRIIIGSEAGQLASDQDRANWADRIDERRANFGNPQVIFQTIKKFTRAGYLPSDSNIQITVDWPNAFKMSPLENAQTAAQHARSATNFSKAIETMYKLNLGVPASPGGTDAATGKVTPAVAEVPGAGLEDLITIPEARKMMWLDKPPVTFDSGEDVNPKAKPGTLAPPRRVQAENENDGLTRRQLEEKFENSRDRRVQISLGKIMRMP